MQIVIQLDAQGLAAVELFASSEDEQREAHRLFDAIQAELKLLDAAAKRVDSAQTVIVNVAEVAGNAKH
jgi:hypothetical protein